MTPAHTASPPPRRQPDQREAVRWQPNDPGKEHGIGMLVSQQRDTTSISMSNQQDEREIAHLERLNADLSQSLQRCRALLKDCRSRLAANSNDETHPPEQAEEEDTRRA